MSAATSPPPPDGTIPRGEDARAMEALILCVRRRAWLDNLRHALLVTAPWGVSALLGGIMVASAWADARRPPPSPEIRVVFIEGGVQTRAELRENLPADRAALLTRNSIRNHLMAREGYAWEAVRTAYADVSATTLIEERDRYQTMMNDKADPRNPFRRYGEGVGAGKARVSSYSVHFDPRSPNAARVSFKLKVQMPRQPECEVSKVAYLTWDDARKVMPLDVQADHSPGGIAFTSYASDPEPGATQPANCPL